MHLKNTQIFLCYASEDKQRVLEAYDRLKGSGYTPWLDKKDLLPGQYWDEEIPKAIKSSQFMLIFFSKISIQKRGYVQNEFNLGLNTLKEIPEGEIFIIPVRLDECQIPERFQRLHYVDFFEEEGLDKVILSIQSKSYNKIEKRNKNNKSISKKHQTPKQDQYSQEETNHNKIQKYFGFKVNKNNQNVTPHVFLEKHIKRLFSQFASPIPIFVAILGILCSWGLINYIQNQYTLPEKEVRQELLRNLEAEIKEVELTKGKTIKIESAESKLDPWSNSYDYHASIPLCRELNSSLAKKIRDAALSFTPLDQESFSSDRGKLLKILADTKVAFVLLNPNPEFSGANLMGEDLRDSYLAFVRLNGANLKKAKLVGADLSSANLRNAYLDSVFLKDSDLSNANLTGAELVDADLKSVNFRNAKLIASNLYNADLRNAILVGADLHRANLEGVDLRGASLSGAYLRKVNLFNVKFRGASFDSAYFIESNLYNADLHSANLTKADFSDAKIISAKLDSADLSEAKLINTELDSTSLKGAILVRAQFDDADLTGADLSGAKLQYADFIDAKLINANLSNANLHEADFINADLMGADLSGANLWQAKNLEIEQLINAKTLYQVKKLNWTIKNQLKVIKPELFLHPDSVR